MVSEQSSEYFLSLETQSIKGIKEYKACGIPDKCFYLNKTKTIGGKGIKPLKTDPQWCLVISKLNL